MPCTIANSDGRFLNIDYRAYIDESSLNKLKKWIDETDSNHPHFSVIESLIQLIDNLVVKQSSRWDYSKNRHTSIQLHYFSCSGSFCNESTVIDRTPEQIKQEIEGISQWHAKAKKDPAIWEVLKRCGIEKDCIPTDSMMKKSATWTIQTHCKDDLVKPGYGWAIWMGSPRNLGYMDDKKRPGGSASARLFESEAAAIKTAKSARFGAEGERGACAVVKMFIEPLEVTKTEGQAPLLIESVIKGKEADQLMDALEYGTIEGLQAALDELPAPDYSLANALAGQEEGIVIWMQWAGQEGGFLNYRNQLGPLKGAMVHPLNKKQNSYYYNEATHVKVRIRPVALGAFLGEPNVKDVEQAIDFEQKKIDYECLKNQTKETLRDAMKQRQVQTESISASDAPRKARRL